jgi:hypothetical protein
MSVFLKNVRFFNTLSFLTTCHINQTYQKKTVWEFLLIIVNVKFYRLKILKFKIVRKIFV